MSKFARWLQFVIAFPCLGILMIKASNDFSRSNLNHTAPHGSDPGARDGMPGKAGVASSSPQSAQSAQASNAGLAELKRLNQTLKPRRQAAAGAAGPRGQALEVSVAHLPSQPQPSVADRFSPRTMLAPLPDLPKRRLVGIEDICSMNQQSKLLLEKMAGPSARTLLQSPLFQLWPTNR